MIQNTFQHLKHIGANTEKKLWQKGVFNWNDYINYKHFQNMLPGLPSELAEIQESLDALNAGDSAYFAERLHPHEFYRVALTFPNEVLFLDIETTGLSIYYDEITLVGWSRNGGYGVFINGDNEHYLEKLFDNAKIIVTFNGTLFDLKFITHKIPSVSFPLCHIDLRFFAKRVGLNGGQKSIEEQIGITRNNNINGMRGESAPILWHKYRRGDTNALKRLIEYNHADIEGMKAILDRCIELLYCKDSIPQEAQSRFKFVHISSRIIWNDFESRNTINSINIRPYTGNNKISVTYKELNDIILLDNFCVVGIDLVSSQNKESGVCLLTGNKAETYRIKSDEELISLIINSKATLVSIDSPLSIPAGRTTFWDTDPMRKYGITRECERILKKRGISSYPCLIQSMQKLTCRGMELSNKLRKLGMPVIESYPGAAQDIMNIPRKQAGLVYLAEGLKEFGIEGDFLRIPVSHDELDAITSAIVGLFFWAGKFERLGNPEEDYLIVPDPNANPKTWTQRIVAGFSGTIGSGKTTATAFMESWGFVSARFSNELRNILCKRGITPTRSSLQELGWKIHKTGKQRWLGKKTARQVANEQKIAIDGLRFPEDHASLVECFGPAFKHVYIDSSKKVRTSGAITGEVEDVPLDEVLSHKVESGITQMPALAHYRINNNSTKGNLLDSLGDIFLRDMKCL